MEDEGAPISFKVLRRGTPVHASDGAQVGTVQRVSYEHAGHIFDGIVVRTDDGLRFVDAPEVGRIAERRVTLTIDSAAAAELPDHPHLLGRMARRLRRGFDRRVQRARRRWS